MNLTKGGQDVYTENYKALLREMRDLNEWKDNSCSWIKRGDFKMAITH